MNGTTVYISYWLFQGMTLLIPVFVFMAFAHSASMMYIGLTLFAFGKWNPSLPLVFKSQNMQHLFVESVLHPFILYLKKNALSVFVVYCHELSGMVPFHSNYENKVD